MNESPVLQFGPFQGQTVAEIAAAGHLDYLRWLRAQRRAERPPNERTALDAALDTVVGD